MTASLPAEFVDRLAQELPDAAAEVLAALRPPARIGARLNPLVTDPESLRGELHARYGDAVGDIAGLPHGLAFAAHARAGLVDDACVRGGALYLQNPSSQLPVLALDVRPGQEVLDLAAAPGGKTLHIAALLAGSGRLAAVEAVKPRFHRLRENLRQGGAGNVFTYLDDGRRTGRKTPGRFERVLLDAPCSSEARFDVTEPGSWAHWSTRKVGECQRKQRGLLASAFAALRPGGRLVYSTCAFGVAENEAVVDGLLREAGAEVDVLAWVPPCACTTLPGRTQHAGRALDPRLAATVRVLPDGLFDGFYLAVLVKRG